MKLFLYFLALSSLSLSSFSQVQINDNEIPGVVSANIRNFDSTGLWDYIDGGADIYLEYGFRRVTVQDLKQKDYHYLLEVYEMSSPMAAFGIYSVSRYDCFPVSSSTLMQAFHISCTSAYQLSLVIGPCFIRISHNTKTDEEQMTSINIAVEISKKIKNYHIVFPEAFVRLIPEDKKPGFKYIKGKLGLQNSYPELMDYFKNISAYQIFSFTLNEAGNVFAYCSFESEKDRKSFEENLHLPLKSTEKAESDICRQIFSVNTTQVIYLYTTNKDEFREWSERINKIIH